MTDVSAGSGRYVGAHLDGHQHGVSIQISINLWKTLLRISSVRTIAVNRILAKVFAYLSYFYFQILDLIFWTVLIFYFDLFWMAWHWKLAILTQLLRLLTKTNIYTHTIYNISCSVWLIPSLTLYKGLHYLYYLQCGTYTTYNTIRSLTVLTIQMLTW